MEFVALLLFVACLVLLSRIASMRKEADRLRYHFDSNLRERSEHSLNLYKLWCKAIDGKAMTLDWYQHETKRTAGVRSVENGLLMGGLGGIIAASLQALGLVRPPGFVMLAANAIVILMSLRSK